jgi:hypothetical protein
VPSEAAQPSPAPAGAPSRAVPAVAFLLATATGLLACLVASLTRLQLNGASPPALFAVAAAAAIAIASPLRGSLVVFAVLPLFGNHPGGRGMELLDLLVAAATVGLALRALRSGRRAPTGELWRAAGLVLLTATIALVPALPELWTWAARIDDFRSTLTQALTASETVPLYSAGSWFQLLLAAAWAYALAWAGAGRSFVRTAFGVVASGLFAVMLLGALEFHHLVDLRHDLLGRIDTSVDLTDRFQSIFWNPGWFACYFSVAFGLSLGLLWLARWPRRGLVAAGLAVSYLYFLTNSQRGGFIAVHVVLLALLVLAKGALPRLERRWLIVAAAFAVLALLAAHSVVWEGRWPLGLQRLFTPQVDVNRRNLWICAIRMWRTAPLLGLGEGSFGWRYREFIPAGSPLDIGAWGDAHSTWLQVLAARGLVGFAAYLILLARLALRARCALRLPGPDRGIGVGLALGTIAFVAYSFVQHMFYLQSSQVFFWGVVALSWIATAEASPALAPKWRRAWPCVLLVAAALGAQIVAAYPLFREAAAKIAREPRGFYPLDRGARRWSSRRGTLCLYPTAPVMTLDLSTADPSAARRPVVVTLSSAGRLLDRFPLARGGITRTIVLSEARRYQPPVQTIPFGECLSGVRSIPLTVEVSRLWSPQAFGSPDGRLFGVRLYAPTFRAPRAGDPFEASQRPLQ